MIMYTYLRCFAELFALNKKTESDGIFNFFSDLLQFCPGLSVASYQGTYL